jgi:hypothetical protein
MNDLRRKIMFKGFKHRVTLLIAIICSSSTFASQTQICRTITEIPKSTPTSQFIQNDNGTVTDNATRLIWMRCSLGQNWDGTTCQGDARQYSWQDALQAAQDENSNIYGYSDWRLPNIKELTSIVEEACYNPAINLTIFPEPIDSEETEYDYWTSTSYFLNKALKVRFKDGFYTYYYNRDQTYRVRLVRGGQP